MRPTLKVLISLIVLVSCGDTLSSDRDGLLDSLRGLSFERVLCPEDPDTAVVTFTHFADEDDPVQDDYYTTAAKGVVLGIQDSQYVIFTTRCAVDFEWPNHEIRWRDIHGYEDGGPELLNEGLIVHLDSVTGRPAPSVPESPGPKDEWFAYVTAELTQPFQQPQPAFGVPSVAQWQPQLAQDGRRRVLTSAREVGDVVRVDRFEGEKGWLSDVALIYVPIHRESTIRLPHLGLTKPKDAVREVLANQSVLFGLEFEFSCPHCQEIVQGYVSQEKEAFLLGFAGGVVTGRFLLPFLEKLIQADRGLGLGEPVSRWGSPTSRLAPPGLRATILDRDGYQCSYAKFGMCDPPACWACLAQNLHIDHVTPFSRGGLTVADNLVTSCAACNLSKGAETLSRWLADGGR